MRRKTLLLSLIVVVSAGLIAVSADGQTSSRSRRDARLQRRALESGDDFGGSAEGRGAGRGNWMSGPGVGRGRGQGCSDYSGIGQGRGAGRGNGVGGRRGRMG